MVLLLVDVQVAIVTDKLYQYDAFVSQVKRLLVVTRCSHTEVIYVRHEDGTDLIKGTPGFEVYGEFSPMLGEIVFDKHVNSSFKDTGLTEYLRSKEEKTIMIVGMQTDYCIDAAIKCGFEHGFQMIVPAYCNTTVDNEYMTAEQSYRYYNEKMWNGRYARCVRFEEACAMF